MSFYLKNCLLELRIAPGQCVLHIYQCVIDKSIFLYNHHFTFTRFHRIPSVTLTWFFLGKGTKVHAAQKIQPYSDG